MESAANEVPRHDECGSSGATIEIKIKTMDSQTYSLRVNKQMSVPALKEQVASVTGVVTDHQRLICRGKVLKDDQLLSAYHVEDGHTLHLVVREPASSSSESLPTDPALDRSSSGSGGQFYQVAPGVVIETYNMPGQGDRILPDVRQILSHVLGSMGVASPGNGSEGTGIRNQGAEGPAGAGTPVMSSPQTQREQSGMRGQSDRSMPRNAFGIPAAVSFGSQNAPVIPDALSTLSQYLNHMKREFINTGRAGEDNIGDSSFRGDESGSNSSPQPENGQERLPSPASLAELLSYSRQMLNQQAEECLLRLTRQLENQENVTDPVMRASVQSDALRTGVLLQNLGSYFLELGRTVTTLRLGRSPSEAVVNAGPAVFISSSGPNPLMVQPLPFQPGSSFTTPLSGNLQSGSGLISGLGSGFVPRRIDIQIRRGPSTQQTEQAGSRQSSDQRLSSTNVSRVTPSDQPAAGASQAPPSSSGSAVRVLPFRTMMAAVPDLNRLPSESSGGSLGMYYPVLGRFPNIAAGNSGGRTGNRVSGEHNSSSIQTDSQSNLESATFQQNSEDAAGNGQVPASAFGESEQVTSRTIDINILSAGGVQNDLNTEGQGQVSSGILQFLRGLFPGGEIQVESVTSQGTAMDSASEQRRASTTAAEASEPVPTEEGIFLSNMLEQIMPLISQNTRPGERDTSHQRDGSSSSTQAEDSGVGTSRQRSDPQPGPDPKRQKME